MSAPGSSTLRIVALALPVIAAVATPPLHAQTCTVPGSHATIQAAADDPACVTVNLAAQTYPESIVLRRTVTIAGPATGGAVIQGLVIVAGAGTVATLRDLQVENGCVPDAVRAAGGTRLVGENMHVERADGLPCPLTADAIFADGFETGDTTAWSTTSP